MNLTTNTTFTQSFRHYLATTGLTQANFTTSLFKNGAASALTVTITEIGSGFYSISFTPTTSGNYHLSTQQNGVTNVYYHWDIRVDDASTTASAILDEPISSHLTQGTLGDYINKIKKLAYNKLDKNGQQITVYEDDTTTTFKTFISNTSTRYPTTGG